MEKRDAQHRSEADERTAKDHAPDQTEGDGKRNRAPGSDEHAAGGQGLSG